MQSQAAPLPASPLQNGSLRLFRLFGVDVFLHWSWVLVAMYQINRNRTRGAGAGMEYALILSIAEYLAIFAIVLVHEFGHALACKSVGGVAERIVLWPLGGLAFVQPPERPGALLWAIAAGPLVNVILLPLTILPAMAVGAFASHNTLLTTFLFELAVINVVLLVFNMLPVYPLDGGQILRALAWFVIGRAPSLIFAAIVGLIGCALLAAVTLWAGDWWLGIMVAFMAMQSLAALRAGRAMMRLDKLPRHPHATCPQCKNSPLAGPYWRCSCGARFDPFTTGHRCPNCNASAPTTSCPFCRADVPVLRWYGPAGFPVAAAGREEVI